MFVREVWRGGILESEKCTGGCKQGRRQIAFMPCWLFVTHHTLSLDLTCTLYHIPPRRACPSINDKYSKVTCGTSACAEVISSIDDLTLSLLKTGFTV